MKRLVPILSLALACSVHAAPPCPRDPQIPAALPVVSCPTLVMPSPCHWCPQGDVFLDLHYAVAPAPLAKAWAAALRAAGWTLTSNQHRVVNATLGTQRVSLRLDAGRTAGTSIIRLTFSP